jgi:hypothetical protein
LVANISPAARQIGAHLVDLLYAFPIAKLRSIGLSEQSASTSRSWNWPVTKIRKEKEYSASSLFFADLNEAETVNVAGVLSLAVD